MVFGIFWLTALIMACNEFAIISAAVSWYFSDKSLPCDDGIPGEAEVLSGIWWTYRYQFGTLALGSFLLAIVWTIRAIFEYIGQKVKDVNPGNPVVDFLISVIRCCLDCFDRFIRYINRNAYIYSCINSENFCISALNSFLLILRNISKFGFVECIATAFIFLAKSFICVATTVIGYFLIGEMVELPIERLTPCFIIFVFGYIIANTFISPFDISANTILQCYILDKDVADRFPGRDMKHLPNQLEVFFDQSTREYKKNDGDEEENKGLMANSDERKMEEDKA